jgi:hypothetical protein
MRILRRTMRSEVDDDGRRVIECEFEDEETKCKSENEKFNGKKIELLFCRIDIV